MIAFTRWALGLLALVLLGTATLGTIPMSLQASSLTTTSHASLGSGVPWQS